MAWIVVSFLLALVLDFIALGETLSAFNPPWTLMVLIYWCWIVPGRVGPGVGFGVGLLVDTLSAGVLGVNALGGALVGFLANKMLAMFSRSVLWQHAVMVLGLVLVHKAVVGWIQSLFDPGGLGMTYWLSALVVLPVWPLVYTLLKELTPIRRRV